MSRLRITDLKFLSAAMLAALCVGFTFFAIVTWTLVVQQKQELQREQVFWKTFASSYFEWNGSWEHFGDRLSEEMMKRGVDADFRVALWNAKGENIVEGSNVDSKRQSLVMANGDIIGRIAVVEERNIPHAWTILGAFVSGCVTFGCIYIAMRRRDRQMRSELQTLSAYAKKIAAQDSSAAVAPQDETVIQTLERAAVKVNRLESVRQTMIADIAHELRTPIAVIRTKLDNGLAAGQPWGPEKLMMLQDEIFRVSALIKDMQELTLAESRLLNLKKKWFNVSELLDQIAETMIIEAVESGIHLDKHWDAECFLYADETRIRQILVNIIGNAIKHAQAQVMIRCDAAPHHVKIAVRDDGMGLEPDELPRVFDRFYRGTKSRKGLGLGLAIAKEYAEAHGGRIEVYSNWGQGASFVLTVPVFQE